jgi:hypothetical protein
VRTHAPPIPSGTRIIVRALSEDLKDIARSLRTKISERAADMYHGVINATGLPHRRYGTNATEEDLAEYRRREQP